MSVDSKRLHWVDVAKGLLILLLLVHHFASVANRLGLDTSQYWFVLKWQIVFTCFFMQAFFFLSGFCSSFTLPIKVFIVKLLKQLIIPLVCFQLIHCLWMSYPRYGLSLSGIIKVWFGSNGSTLWFLNALIVSKIVVYAFLRFHVSHTILVSFSLFLLFVAVLLHINNWGSNFLFIRQSLASVFFVALGFVLKSNIQMFNKLVSIGSSIFPYLLLSLLIFDLPIPQMSAIMQVGFFSLPVFLLVSVSGTFACIRLCMYINKLNVLEYLGINTLLIYCIHFIVLMSVSEVLYSLLHPQVVIMSVLYVVLVYSIVIAICVFLIELYKTKALRWMLGRF